MDYRRSFTHAVVCQIPNSYATKAEGVHGKVDMKLARQQHQNYVDALTDSGVKVTVLKADEKYADCLFVEDAAVIVGDHALITKPGVNSREGETIKMKEHLEALGLIVMTIRDKSAKLDGGDVIFTGHELLCGLSKRTNKAGMAALGAAFPGFTVVPVKVTGPLHLTTSVGYCYENTLCVSTQTPASGEMLASIRANSKIDYNVVYVNDDNAANCIWMNKNLICKSAKENPEAYSAIKASSPGDRNLVGLDISEIEKAVGSLTCMSLRFSPTGVLKPSQGGPKEDTRNGYANGHA